MLSLFSPYLYISIAAFRIDELFNGQKQLIYAIESSFVVSMLTKFLTDYNEEGESSPKRDLN